MIVLSLFLTGTSTGVLNLLSGCGDSPSTPPPPPPAPINSTPPSHLRDPVDVLRVIDGDTVEIRKETEILRVRFKGIDTPELHPQPDGSPPEPFAESARSFTLMHIGSQVDLEFDSDCDSTVDPFLNCLDSFGRLLAYIRTADGRDLGVKLLTQGLARVYRFPGGRLPDFDRQTTYLLMEEDAKSQALGIWSSP